jgi:hypothetical protein
MLPDRAERVKLRKYKKNYTYITYIIPCIYFDTFCKLLYNLRTKLFYVSVQESDCKMQSETPHSATIHPNSRVTSAPFIVTCHNQTFPEANFCHCKLICYKDYICVCVCVCVCVSEATYPAQPKRKGKSKYIGNKN